MLVVCTVTVGLNVDCGTTRLRAMAQAFPGTFSSVHNLSSVKIQKMVLLGQNYLLLKSGLQEISPQGDSIGKGFFAFVYSQLLAFSDLLFPACLVRLFAIVLTLYCNYLSSHVQNSIPQLPCSPIFSLKPTHFNTFPLYFPCSYKFLPFSG